MTARRTRSTAPSIALATARGAWEQDDDGPLLVAELEALGATAVPAIWDDPAADWAAHDLVVVRSTWDYSDHRADFLDWARRVESVTRLENPSQVLEWNTDKGYLGELAADGIPCVPTAYLRCGDPDPVDPEVAVASFGTDGGVVVKPTVSAGSRDTARHAVDQHEQAAAHVRRLLAAGRDVMVQPYLDSVDRHGETGMVMLEGRLSHTFRKGPMLSDGVADVQGLFAPEHISERTPDPAEVELAHRVVAAATRRSPRPLLYARVDLLSGADGAPTLLELELTEPSFFLTHSHGAARRAADAILRAV